jgi:hypothetical protein
VPGHGRFGRSIPIFDLILLLRAVTQANSENLVSESSQLERDLTKPAESIVEQILPHVLTFGEDQNLHL